MAPLGNKGKSKNKDNRQSRSRNTTPGSVVSMSATAIASGVTPFLELAIGSLTVPSNVLYDDILERHGGGGSIPDLKHIEALAGDLKTLSSLAGSRETACDKGMRELSGMRKLRIEYERDVEQGNREAEEKASLKRAAEDDELDKVRNPAKLKKRKEQGRPREERPLAHGAHSVARQDGMNATSASKDSRPPLSPSKVKQTTGSGSSSSLSPPSQLPSPTIDTAQTNKARRPSSAPSCSSDDSHQPPPAASVPQYQTFGEDPLIFDDPTIYHIRHVTDDMTYERRKETLGVSSWPKSDLKHLTAGDTPDLDLSNTKPSNQVAATTFATYIEPYFRTYTEEDITWLKDRGDRVTPFLMPHRGLKHYMETWAEEDGVHLPDRSQQGRDRLPANQPRGSLDQMNDEVAETDQISAGPVLSRLLSIMKPEHRPSVEEKEKGNGTSGESSNQGVTNGEGSGDHSNDGNDGDPPVTYFPDSNSNSWKAPTAKVDYAQVDERLKAELRYIGFLGQDEEPDYDAHFDDEVAQRLRVIQRELREVMLTNSAKKAIMLEKVEKHMAYQEYKTILDDLDNQIVQLYLKRNRTLGKGKKNAKRPGGASGGGVLGIGGASSATGVSKPGIGDVVRTLIDRRKRWIDTIGPIFDDPEFTQGPSENEAMFAEDKMGPYIATERIKWEEEMEEAGLNPHF